MSGMFAGPTQHLSNPNPFTNNTMDVFGLFTKPDTQTPATPPPAPTLGNSAGSLDVAAQQQQLMLQRGRSATLLTGGGGLNSTQSASKTLFGQ